MDRAAGFTLLEIAIVLVVMAVVTGGLLSPLKARLEGARYRETRVALELAERAIVGYSVSRGAQLPCPDGDGDGTEDLVDPPAGVSGPNVRTGSRCRLAAGMLPWRTLGLHRADAWGSPLLYHPDAALLSEAGLGTPPQTMSNLSVIEAGSGTALTLRAPDGPVAIVLSCGPNRRVDASLDSAGQGGGCGLAPEAHGGRYRYGPPGAASDDVVRWLSKNVLLAELVYAGAWPR